MRDPFEGWMDWRTLLHNKEYAMIRIDLSQFDVSPTRGFLPAEDPLLTLPNYFKPWEDTISELPKLLMSGRVRTWLKLLPTLQTDRLEDQRSLDRAMLLLSYFGHAWVWGESVVVDRVPENLAVPWYEVAARLGRPPVLSYASHALNNWRRLDQTQSIGLGNISRLANFLGGLDEEWFVLIHIAIESEAGPALKAAADLSNSLNSGDVACVTESLKTITRTVEILRSILERMLENCDPYIYYHRVRPFIFGWEGNPALPEGVFYEGVEALDGCGQKLRGETGAQSSIVPSLDAALGLRFLGNERFTEHLLRLRDYMPSKHRAFIEALEQNESEMSCRAFIESSRSANPDIADAYNAAVQEMFEFRLLHLKFAGSYIANQQPNALSNPTGTGTGGTPFMTYLRNHADQTLTHKI
jgi:indoleamine 2,3-dioxygenase